MFARFPDLPVELALDIIEFSGWSSVSRSARWVASAALTNGAFLRVLRPIVYHTVRVTPTNFDPLVRVASRTTPNAHFGLTRRVVLDDSVDYRGAMQLVGLFPRAQSVACNMPSYLALRHDPAFAPDELILTRQYDAHDVFGWLAPYFTGTRLCIAKPLVPAPWFTNDFDNLRLTHVILHDSPELLDRLLCIPTLERIVLVCDSEAVVSGDTRVSIARQGVFEENCDLLCPLWKA